MYLKNKAACVGLAVNTILASASPVAARPASRATARRAVTDSAPQPASYCSPPPG
eukprot:COSAG02_NODE_34521_length_482_cov_25.947781_1_plen_54_part_10